MLPSAGTGVALTGGYHAVANKVIINYFAGGKKKNGESADEKIFGTRKRQILLKYCSVGTAFNQRCRGSHIKTSHIQPIFGTEQSLIWC